MSGFIEQFFNIQIMVAAWPTLLRGLAVTLMLCLAVIPMGLFGGLVAGASITLQL
jgi:polar amino acid transport system permease protein